MIIDTKYNNVYDFGEIEKIVPEIIDIRRQLHSFPELSLKEFKTTEFICDFLNKLGIEYKRPIDTGVVAEIIIDEKLPTIALRAEMDALPIQEENSFEYASKNNGVMHACGHDAIVAIALGVASVLNKNKEKLKSNVKFIFEPAEEIGKGAKALIEAGALENPKVNKILIFHLTNSEPLGMEIQRGVSTAEISSVVINIKGKSAHWAERNNGIDAIYASAKVISKIHEVNDSYKGKMPMVVGIGTINGGVKGNIIADSVQLKGSLRTFLEEDKKEIINNLKKEFSNIEGELGASIEFNVIPRIPPIYNDKKLVELGLDVGRKLFGDKNAVASSTPFLAGDNAAFYFEKVPGLRVVFFARREGKINYPLHNSRFNFNEKIIPLAMEAVSKIILELGKNSNK
ncbi:M20 metallopeptidase family protein [Clostridium hydrogenum]|uniref:M20 metallopeptidase family protein n=1 Tax=Clostridium hydrogenum TaxID=2855764 RepID=UPI001F22E6E0|nr:M20 family metallopeptidase [Clostridium hydrogenum]